MTKSTSTSLADILVLWCLVGLVSPALAQTSKLFQWQFANSALATSLPTCASLPIIVKSFNTTTNATQGTPPYYMIAFAVGQTPQTALIGMDENNLSWTVTQPVGSQLILSVVDSNGSAGGIPPQIFTVMAGQSTLCVIPPPTGTAFTVTANVTTELTTCQPWGLTVKGGVPPYVVTLVQLNSPIVTNVTMPNGLDVFTFIDRADPNAKLIAGISDFTGRWATGTPIVSTKGEPCFTARSLIIAYPGSSGNSTEIRQEQEAADSVIQAAKRRRSTATAVVAILMFLLFGGLAVAAFLFLRKRRREDQAEMAEATPQQYIETQSESKLLPTDNYLGPKISNQVSRKAAILAEIHGAQSNTSASPSPSETTLLSNAQGGLDRNMSATSTNPTISTSRSPSRTSGPGFATFPATSIRRSGKLMEDQRVLATRSPDSQHPEVSIIPEALNTSLAGGEVIFQHSDGGVVRELPPPYALRRSGPTSS